MVLFVMGDRSKLRCCKEQYCIGTWNVRSMNQGKLEVVKQEMARVDVGMLGISELKWTGMGEFNSDDHYIYYRGQEITADGDCSHEIKRCLLLGRKVMTNIDSILKSRDITLPRKFYLVRAMLFPVVKYGCESWTVKKAEHRRIDVLNYGVGEDS